MIRSVHFGLPFEFHPYQIRRTGGERSRLYLASDPRASHTCQTSVGPFLLGLNLEEAGFTSSYTIANEAVGELKRTLKQVYMPLTHRAGEDQTDSGHALGKMDGVLPKICLFAATVPYSDAFIVRAYKRAIHRDLLEQPHGDLCLVWRRASAHRL